MKHLLISFELFLASSIFTFAQSPPYPSSKVIKGIEIDWSTHFRAAQGSDNFQLTWADDDHQYGAWGDGGGFGGTNSDGRVHLGIARIEGDWNNHKGYNIWGGKNPENPAQFKGKSWGMLCVNSVLYMWVTDDAPTGWGNFNAHASHVRLFKSVDHGAHWTATEVEFFRSQDVMIPTFLQFGKNYAEANDKYIYSYFIHPGKGKKFDIQTPGKIYLCRVNLRKIENPSKYEWLSGYKEDKPAWSRNIDDKFPVISNPDGTGWNVSASHVPGLDRYIVCTGLKSNLAMLDAPQPWGPWTTVLYLSHKDNSWFGNDNPENVPDNCFFWSFAPKWFSRDGRDATLNFTGSGNGENNDSYNAVRIRLLQPND
jgi:hypothetical protein